MHPLFQTYELLEQILLYLDHTSLRSCRLANTFWHTIIEQNHELSTTYRQRLRMRQLKILVLGAPNVGKRSLIKKWCPTAQEAQRQGLRLQNALVRLPETDGEVWLAQMWSLDGESGLDSLTNPNFLGESLVLDALVLVYDVGSRNSFDELARWWRAGMLSFDGGQKIEIKPSAGGYASRWSDREEMLRLESGASINVRGVLQRYQRTLGDAQGWPCSSVSRPIKNVKPALLALIANKADLPTEARKVGIPEGEELACEMGVPFCEVSAKDTGPDLDGSVALRGFFGTFKEGRMKQKAESQRRQREACVPIDEEEKATEEIRTSKWWRRWSR